MSYLRVLILLFFVNCNKENKIIEIDPVVKQDTSSLTKQNIEKIKYVEYVLDAKAAPALNSWQSYSDVLKAIDDFKTANFDFITEDDEIFKLTLDELISTLPKEIDTESIKARLLVLKTKMYKLRQNIELSNITKKERLVSLEEVFEASAHLTLLINKKYEKDSQKIINPY